MCPGGFSSYVSAKEMYSIISTAGLTHAPGRAKKWKNPSKIRSRFHNTWHGKEGRGQVTLSQVHPCGTGITILNASHAEQMCVSVPVKSQAAVGTAWIQVYPTTQSKQTFQGLRWACLNASTLTTCHVKSAGSVLTTLGLWWRFQWTSWILCFPELVRLQRTVWHSRSSHIHEACKWATAEKFIREYGPRFCPTERL